ncbi:MAG: VOC family protein [Hyphomicrobiales bacterium]
MEQRISLVTLGVGDLARSRRFYEDGLGWKAHFANEGVVFFAMNGTVLCLYPRAELLADAKLTGTETRPGGIALGHNLRSREEVDALLAKAKGAGARILKPAEETFWGGYSGYFADPDGHPWEVAWNPHWTIADDGSIRL